MILMIDNYKTFFQDFQLLIETKFIQFENIEFISLAFLGSKLDTASNDVHESNI